MRLPPTIALWVAWVVFSLASCSVSAMASGVMLDRAPRAALLRCLLAGGIAGAFYRPLRRPDELASALPPESRLASTIHGTLLTAAALVGIAPAIVYNMARPEYLIYAPWLQLYYANLFGVMPFGTILLVLWGASKFLGLDAARTHRAARRQWAATATVFAAHAAWASTAALSIGFFLNMAAFESVRRELSGNGHMTEMTTVGLYRVDRVGDTFDICGRGPYFVIEMCDYPPSRDSCFAGSGGAGFYCTPPGTPDSCFNIGGDGALPGGWRWYVAD